MSHRALLGGLGRLRPVIRDAPGRSVPSRMPTITRGRLPRRALALVLEWAEMNRDSLMEDWELCRQLKPPNPIPPLE